ncbi:MAG: transposase [Clostridia bacterium]|nr:transposase [Clostridia bacterium]
MARLRLNLTISLERAISVYMSKHCWALNHKIASQFSTAFYPLMLSNTKRAEILYKAQEIRSIRNDISEIFFNDMLKVQDMTKYEAFNYFTTIFTGRLSSHYLKKAIEDVWKSYHLRFDAIKKKIEFEKIVDLKPVFYRRKTKCHNAGDLKFIERHTKRTELTKVLTWLARYGNNDTVTWIESVLPKTDEHKRKFYNTILRIVYKCGFDRLMRLALSRRQSVYAEYEKRGRIVFESLTFSGRSRITRPIVCERRNANGKFSYFIEISWDWHDKGYRGNSKNTMCIPFKYNKAYHRNLKRYCNGRDTAYTMVVRNNGIHIVLTRDGYRYKNDEAITEQNTVGIDVNSKHNMFALNNGELIPNDTDLIADLEKTLLTVDAKQMSYNSRFTKDKEHTAFKISYKDKARITAISIKLNESNKRVIASLCRQFANRGIKHIAMENLDGFQGSSLYSTDTNGFNLGRLHLRTSLSSLKDEFEHIAPRYGLSVSLVQPEYTSKMCSHCGCIDDRNRQTQEEFKCIECGHTENADIHSAKNIKLRLTSTVLRGHLLEKARDDGYRNFTPKNLSRRQVREFLEKCHCIGLFKQSVENHNKPAISGFK